MPDKGTLNPPHIDTQKPAPEQKPANQPNQPLQQKPQVPVVPHKSPQSEPENHDQEKKQA